MFETYLVYIILLIFCFGTAAIASKKNKKIYILGIIFALTFVSGFRSYSVGLDTERYVEFFQLIAEGRSEYAYGLEESFKMVCAILYKIVEHPTFLLLVFAGITNTFIILRLWDFRRISSFAWMTAVYYVSFYFYSFNIMRQMCVVAIIFFATRYLTKRRYLIFLIYLTIAFIFHKSSLLGTGFFFIEILQWNLLTKKQKKFMICMLVLVPFCFVFVLMMLGRYQQYFENTTFQPGIMFVIKLGLFLLSTFGLRKRIRPIYEESERNLAVYELGMIRFSYLIGIAATGIGYFFSYMDRIGLMYYIFECVYFGMIVKITKNKNEYKIIVGLLLCYVFLMSLMGGGQGQVPYSFIWQSK